MLTLSRRGLLALGGTGAAGIVLAGCGEAADQRDDASPQALLDAELEAELALAAAYRAAGSTVDVREQRSALDQFAAAAGRRADELSAAGAEGTEAPAPDGGPDGPEALDAAANLANSAIAAHRDACGLLDTTEGRARASSYLAACAAELGAVNGFRGEPEAPRAFVTGGAADPYEAVDSASEEATSEDGQEETTTGSTTTAAQGTG